MTSRSYCFTLNNYTAQECNKLEDSTEYGEDATVRYLIYGYEVGENGTPHLQGYLELRSPERISGVKRLLGIPRIHLEPRRGSRNQARTYCQKAGDWIEFGSWEAGGQGHRTDLDDLVKAIRQPNRDIKIIMEDYATVYSRNMRFAEKYLSLVERDETRGFREVEVNVYYGDAGTGKSRKVREEYPEAFTVNPEDSFPFDGYDGEQTILIDDYKGNLKYKQLLKVLDGYQYRVNVKGGHRYARWTKVFITSDVAPQEWYHVEYDRQLARRIKSVTEFRHEVGGNTAPPLDILVV